MSTVAITGSAGYFGEKLVTRLRERPGVERIIGIDVRDPQPVPFDNVEHFRLDIRNSLVPRLFSSFGVDTIIHLAFSVKPIHNRREMHEINLVGALNLLRAAHMAQVRRIILLSSTTVYGFHRNNPFYMTEDHPTRPNRDLQYAVDKVEVERLMRQYARKNPDCQLVILRPCSMTGSKVQNYLSDYLSNSVVPVVMGYDPLFQFVHVDDVVSATLRACDRRDATGVYNVVGDGAIPLRNVVKLSGGLPVPVPTPIARPVTDLLWYLKLINSTSESLQQFRFSCLASNRRLQKDLGVKLQHSSESALVTEIDAQRIRKYNGSEAPRRKAPLSDALREYYHDRERAEEERILRITNPARRTTSAPKIS
jgi:UDP-glucose 4-epimerase